MKRLSAILPLLLLTACVSPEQQAQRQQVQEEEDYNTCVNYGLRPGSEAFGTCRLQLDLAREDSYYFPDPYGYHGYYPRSRLGLHYGFYH